MIYVPLRKMDFGRWLRIQKYRNDPIGDLACDAVNDHWKGSTPESLEKRMNEKGACSQAFNALKKAISDYEKQMIRKPIDDSKKGASRG